MRQWLSFDCQGVELAGALDPAEGTTGLLIVSGGNEIASGAHAGMAGLATRVAAAGFPVFRFDRRGVGDSAGENRGYEASMPDIAAAITVFRAAAPAMRRLVLFGNCDAATSLGLFHKSLGGDALILTNPWLIDVDSPLPPPAAIKARYARKLRDPREWLRLLKGGVNIYRLIKGLSAVSYKSKENELAGRLGSALADSTTPTCIILAKHDATALAFAECWRSPAFATVRNKQRVALTEIDTGSHSFARPTDADALQAEVIGALRAVSGVL